jgi:integrase
MARRGINRLPASYQRLKPGLHADGGCLYLQVSIGTTGNRRASWVFRYQMGGRTRDMGLGSINDIALGEARDLAREYRRLAKQGIDPIDRRNAEVARNLAANVAVMTFDAAADAYIRAHRSAWRNVVHAQDWVASVRSYASPILGKMSVADIETSHITRVLGPIWDDKTVTAKRVRGRIESILGWATTAGYRQGDNPARWRDHLENVLARPDRIRPVKHLAALPFEEMPGFYAALCAHRGVAALALRFLILTAVRPLDVRHARRTDINRDKRLWAIPAFSKTGRPHRVPLSAAAVAVLDQTERLSAGSEFQFPGEGGRRLAASSLRYVIDHMQLKGRVTVHGSRAVFRTWVMEATNFPRELAELALGHTVGSGVERAYARGDMLAKRAALMETWGRFPTTPSQAGKVVPLRWTAS